jgi:phage regulator Rha-like protein
MPTKKTPPAHHLITVDSATDRIRFVRGEKVMLDSDLAELYGVTTSNLNKAVKRNLDRFPEDFMFQLTRDEYAGLRFQIGILKRGQHAKYFPYVFTEQGVAMLSSVLRSKRAVQVNIAIMRAFIQIRSVLAAHKALARKIEQLERTTETKFEAITKLIKFYLPHPKKTRLIGFRTKDTK